MKRMICFMVMLTGAISAFSQFTVTKVYGDVTNKVSHEKLKTGSKFKAASDLKFNTSNDVVRAIATGKGLVVISANAQQGDGQNNAIEVLKYTFNIKPKEAYLSGRGATDEVVPQALTPDTMYSSKDVFEKENKYLFDKTVYQVANGDKFFLQIESDGGTPVIHTLNTRNDTLIITASDLRISTAVSSKCVLGYYSVENNNSASLLGINPYMDITGEMENIIKIMIRESKNTDKDALQKLCYREVYESLGKPSAITFREMFDRLILAGANATK